MSVSPQDSASALDLECGLLTAAAKGTANGIVVTDARGEILWANPAFTRITGYEFSEIRGQNPRFLKSGQHDSTFYAHMWNCIRSGNVWRSEIRNRRKDGSLYIEEMTITPITDDEAKGLNVVAYLVKPLRRNPLVTAILKAVGSSEQGAQLGGDRRALAHLVMQNSCKILMAEDNVVSQIVTTLLLQRLRYHVDVVGDGKEAVDSFRVVDYDLVLMDCQMPNMDGFAATEAIRALERERRHTPIIALTASALKGERERCLAAGMDDYLTKPITPEALVEALQTWVGNGKDGR